MNNDSRLSPDASFDRDAGERDESTGLAGGSEGFKVTKGARSPSAVDFSPVLQAVQGKLATLTQENIGLKDTIASLQQQLADLDRQYQDRLQTAETKLQEEKADEVRRVTQALRIRERQQDAFASKGIRDKLSKEVEALQKQLRDIKEDKQARESVLNQTIDKLKRKLAAVEGGKAEQEQEVQRLETERRKTAVEQAALRSELQLLRQELNSALAETARIRGVQAAEAGAP